MIKNNYFESLPLLKQTAWAHPWGNFQNNFLIELVNHTFCKLLKIHSVKVKLKELKKNIISLSDVLCNQNPLKNSLRGRLHAQREAD